jgi:hypothetical protein
MAWWRSVGDTAMPAMGLPPSGATGWPVGGARSISRNGVWLPLRQRTEENTAVLCVPCHSPATRRDAACAPPKTGGTLLTADWAGRAAMGQCVHGHTAPWRGTAANLAHASVTRVGDVVQHCAGHNCTQSPHVVRPPQGRQGGARWLCPTGSQQSAHTSRKYRGIFWDRRTSDRVLAVGSHFPVIFGQNVTSFQVQETGCANQRQRQEHRTRMVNLAVTETHSHDHTANSMSEQTTPSEGLRRDVYKA